MVDVLTPEQRKRCMSNIKNKNTKPEIIVRKIAHSLGFRFRLHKKGLPGKPDLVFPRLGKIIFVHGCFWHMHNCKYGIVKPKTRAEFWEVKRQSNVDRDLKNRELLEKENWEVMVIWECETRDFEKLENKISKFLSG